MAIADKLITIDEYFAISDPNQPTELVRGRIVPMNVPAKRHGRVCFKIAYYLELHGQKLALGRSYTNGSCVITERDPDTVRGPDVSFVSFSRLPKDSLSGAYDPSVPEIAFEVKSPSDRWIDVHEKVVEFLKAGVLAVGVADPEERSVRVYFADSPEQYLRGNDELRLPMIGDFRCDIAAFFED